MSDQEDDDSLDWRKDHLLGCLECAIDDLICNGPNDDDYDRASEAIGALTAFINELMPD